MGLCIPPLPILSCEAACESNLIHGARLTALSLYLLLDIIQYSVVDEPLKQLT